MTNYEFQEGFSLNTTLENEPLQIEHDLSLKLYDFSILTRPKYSRSNYYKGRAGIAVPAELLLDLGLTDPALDEAVQLDTIKQLVDGDSLTAREFASNMTNISTPELPKYSGVLVDITWIMWLETYKQVDNAKIDKALKYYPRTINNFVDSYLHVHDETIAAFRALPDSYKGNLERVQFRISAADMVWRYAESHQ